MNSTPHRRFVAIAGAAAITIITMSVGPVASATASGHDTTRDRPCFMVRAHWNTAEGPQPTCPVPSWQRRH